MTHRRLGLALVLPTVAALGLTACSTSADHGGQKSHDHRLKVVTSTNVYSDVVRQVAGDDVEVTPLVNSTSQDPHSYEATAQDRLKAKDADLIVINGAGYDHFLEDLTQDSDAKVVNAAEASGLAKTQEQKEGKAEGFNEHVWYSFAGMQKVTDEIAQDLGDLDSEHRQQYQEKAEKFDQRLDGLAQQAKKVNGRGKKYLATEPVPGYLLQATGMEDATPEEFAAAVEEDSDVPAATMKSTHDLVKQKKVRLMAFNSQTETSQTTEIKDEAQRSGVPTVSFTETLPDGKDYASWMEENVQHVSEAMKK